MAGEETPLAGRWGRAAEGSTRNGAGQARAKAAAAALCAAVLVAGALPAGAAHAAQSIADAQASGIEEAYRLEGGPVEPDITVTLGKAVLEEGADYEVAYEDNDEAGTGRAVIEGKGAYNGTLAVTFEIEDGEGDEDAAPDGAALAKTAEREFKIAQSDSSWNQGAWYWTHVVGGAYANGGATPWCGCFVGYCWQKSGLEDALGAPANPASAGAWAAWAAKTGKGEVMAVDASYKARPGDIVLQNYSGGYADHIGICTDVDEDGKFTCVDGNWGDEVARSRNTAPGFWTHAVRFDFDGVAEDGDDTPSEPEGEQDER